MKEPIVEASAVTPIDLIRSKWNEGQPAFGAWVTIQSPLVAEILGQFGFDWICVDLQHGMAGLESCASILQAISLTSVASFVRVPSNEQWLILRVLDLGAQGIIVPLVNTAAEARRASTACRYPPAGVRSFAPVRIPSWRYLDAGYCNSQVLCLVQIETREGMDNLDEICAVEGVDGVFVGPRDLGLSLGVDPGASLDLAFAQIRETCLRLGVPPGIYTSSGQSALTFTQEGFLWASVTNDRQLLASSAERELSDALATQAPTRVPHDSLLRTVI